MYSLVPRQNTRGQNVGRDCNGGQNDGSILGTVDKKILYLEIIRDISILFQTYVKIYPKVHSITISEL